jgi:O-antigen/teichoic acid export membrane protein
MLRSIIASIILAIVLFLVQHFHYDAWIHPYIWYILSFFVMLSFLIHRLMEYGLRNNREKFVTFYLSTIVGRLILSIIFIGIFLYSGLTDSFTFVLNFFALYLFYTCFEIYGLYCNLRRD